MFFKIINNVKVHFIGPMSVNRKEAIRANWQLIKKLSQSFYKK